MEGGAPHPVEGAQVEGGGQHGPLGRHVGEATQQEPTCPLLYLDDSEDRARLADGSRGPVQMQRNSIRMLDAKELEPPSLWTRKTVALLVIGESVLVIRVCEEPLPCF